jgi:hypothetical protein
MYPIEQMARRPGSDNHVERAGKASPADADQLTFFCATGCADTLARNPFCRFRELIDLLHAFPPA